MQPQPTVETVRHEPKALFTTIDGRTIAAMYFRVSPVRAIVLIPREASRWEERVAVRMVAEIAASKDSAYEKLFLDEVPPQPRLQGVN